MDTDKSYSDAMDEWARKNSFFGDRGNRLIHPDPNLPVGLRILGYLIRVLVVAFVVMLLVMFGLRKYVGSEAFAEKVGAEIAGIVRADEYQASRLQWNGKRMSMNAFTATGGEGAFFRSLEARYFRFHSSPTRFLGPSWKLSEVTLEKLDVVLRSGGKTDNVPGQPAAAGIAGAPVLIAGFAPQGGGRLQVDSLRVLAANLRWGLTDRTLGALEGAGLLVGQADTGWRLGIEGGEWSQNWLRGVRVHKLTILPDGANLLFRDGELGFPSGGRALIEGSVATGVVPVVDLRITVEEARFSDFVADAYASYIDGTIEGSLRITGSINTQSGIEIAGDLRVRDGILRDIPVLDAVSIVTETTRIRYLPIDSGTLRFQTGEGKLRVTDFDLLARDTARITGAFRFEPPQVAPPADDPLAPFAADIGAAPVPAAYHFDGSMRLGVLAASLERAKELGAKYFSEEADGYRWMEVELRGTPEQVTRGIHDQMIADLRTQRDSR